VERVEGMNELAWRGVEVLSKPTDQGRRGAISIVI